MPRTVEVKVRLWVVVERQRHSGHYLLQSAVGLGRTGTVSAR